MDLNTLLVPFIPISALITYGLGIFVLASDTSSRVNRLFFAMMAGGTYWAAGEFLIWYVNGSGGTLFWLHFSAFWTCVIAITVHFVLAFTRHPLAEPGKFRYLLGILYLPSLGFAFAILLDLTYAIGYRPGLGYSYIPLTGTPLYTAGAAYFLCIMLWAEYVAVTAWLRATQGRIRRQYLLVSAGMGTVIVTGVLSGIVLPASGIYTPNLVFIGISCFSVIISYAILRYGLFVLTPSNAATGIIRAMPDGLVLAGMDGRIVSVNDAARALFGIGERVMPGLRLADILPAGSIGQIADGIRETGGLSDFEAVLDRDGCTVVSIAGSLVRGPDGEPEGFVLIVRDITGRKKSERSLRMADEKISLLIRLTRHDIGNLVTALNGYLTLLDERVTNPDARQYVSSSIGLVDKITRYLQFSKQYQEIGRSRPQWESLGNMVNHAIGDLDNPGIGITTSLAPVEIFADPLFDRVAYNLLENAILHGQGLTGIRVSTEEDADGGLVIAFDDDGTGIREEDKDRIFLQGYGRNTGLGLSLSREILAVTEIGLAETGTEGSGARFELRVPRDGWRAG